MSFVVTPTPPPLIADGAALDQRVQQLKTPLVAHFFRLRTLDRYSRRVKTDWFAKASVSAPSVMLSTIRSAEKTAIAYLAGGKPTWRVASYGGYAGSAQQDAQREGRDVKFERLARAIFHHIDRQSEQNLLYDPVERAVRQGEIIFQYGWLDADQRRIGDPASPEMQGGLDFRMGDPDDAGGADPLPAPGGPLGPGPEPAALSPQAPPPSLPPMIPQLAASQLGAESRQEGKPRARFPIFVRVHDRMRVFYELDPFGEPLEVYHQYTARASQLAEEFPVWADSQGYQPDTVVQVVQAWVGAWTAITVAGSLIEPARLHGYGARPPFIIERCAPENVAERALDDGVAEVRAGTPFCLDMLEAYEQACLAASLKRAILENAAIGSYVLENASAQRYVQTRDGTEVALDMVIGPGTIIPLYKDEKLVAAPVAVLPPALAAYLESAMEDMAILSFSPKLLMGDSQGDPSGYGIEQVRQAAMARLMPYRDALGRGFSRLFEKIFVVLSQEWAAEWGDSVTFAGQHNGKFFAETVTPQDLTPPPDHVEMVLTPAVPQNKLAEHQDLVALTGAGLMDPLVALEERGSPDPQEEWDSILLHKEQLENQMVRPMAVKAIIEKRAMRSGVQLPGVPGQTADIPDGLGIVPALVAASQGGMPPPGGPPGPGGPPPGPPGPGGPPPLPPPGMTGGPNLGAPPPPMPGMRPNQAPPGPPGPLRPAPRVHAKGPPPQRPRPGAPAGVPGAINPPVMPPPRRPMPGGR